MLRLIQLPKCVLYDKPSHINIFLKCINIQNAQFDVLWYVMVYVTVKLAGWSGQSFAATLDCIPLKCKHWRCHKNNAITYQPCLETIFSIVLSLCLVKLIFKYMKKWWYNSLKDVYLLARYWKMGLPLQKGKIIENNTFRTPIMCWLFVQGRMMT